MWLVLFIITEKTYEFDWCCNSHFVSEYQIENKANDSKHNAHACEYTVGDEEPHCHGLMLMTPRGASCIHTRYTKARRMQVNSHFMPLDSACDKGKLTASMVPCGIQLWLTLCS